MTYLYFLLALSIYCSLYAIWLMWEMRVAEHQKLKPIAHIHFGNKAPKEPLKDAMLRCAEIVRRRQEGRDERGRFAELGQQSMMRGQK